MRIQVLALAAFSLHGCVLGYQQSVAGGDGSTGALKVASWVRQAAREASPVPVEQSDPSYDYVAVKFASADDGAHIDQMAESYASLTGWENAGPLGTLPAYRVFRNKKKSAGARLSKRSDSSAPRPVDAAVGAEAVVPLGRKRLFKRALVTGPAGFGDRFANATDTAWHDIVDPLYGEQWHLVNSKESGHDINVTGVWHQGVTGAGVTVALIDDGLDYSSEDLLENFDFRGSYDFNDRTKLPTPRLEDDYHGTRCAGQIAAARNDVCGVGVAYGAKVAGIRMLSKEVTDQDEVTALNYAMDRNWIYSCSWGPNDDGATVQAPGKAIEDAFVNGVRNGRGGLGSIFVFATGNGGGAGDNCNFDGYTNSIYTMSIGAIDHQDRHPFYSEQCSAQLAVTYSNGDNRGIVTTDLGLRRCTNKHGGTSAAAPLGAGIFALALSVRPDLTWRDVQHLAVRTAIPVDLADSDWADVARGRRYNHKYGFGKMDAWRIVEGARTFQHVGRQASIAAAVDKAGVKIPPLERAGGPSQSIERTVEITRAQTDAAKMRTVEHVTVVVDIEHEFRGNVEVWLESPHGVRSQLAAMRHRDNSASGLRGWKFMSVKHWDEDPVGSWKLQVRNAYQPQYSGTFNSWQLTVYGESTEAEPPHKVPVVDDGPEALPPPPPPPPSDKESTHIPDGNDGRGHIGKAIAVLLSVAFFVAGAAVAGLATVVVMRWRERKLGAARWAPLQNMDRSEEEVIFSADPLPDEDAFEYTDVTAGASSASVVKHHGRSGGDGGAGDGAENSRSHGGSRHDSEDTAENYPLV